MCVFCHAKKTTPKTGDALHPQINPESGNQQGLKLTSRLGNKVDCIAKGLDSFGFIIGDFDAELLLKRHDQFDCIQAIRAEIINK